MTARPWMPLYIADYLRDTAHLRALESGAYLHLIMAYWVGGGLPKDDRQLATIAKVTDREWRTIKPVIAAFFGPGFESHKRIDAELEQVSKVSKSNSDKAREAAHRRWSKNSPKHAPGDAPSNARHDAPECTLHTSHSVPNGTGVPPPEPDPKAELFKRGRVVLGAKAGALISKVLKSCGPEDDPKTIAKARAHIETASTKAAPAEWIGRILSQKPSNGGLFEGQVEGIM